MKCYQTMMMMILMKLTKSKIYLTKIIPILRKRVIVLMVTMTGLWNDCKGYSIDTMRIISYV